jgi:hypothetical protein
MSSEFVRCVGCGAPTSGAYRCPSCARAAMSAPQPAVRPRDQPPAWFGSRSPGVLTYGLLPYVIWRLLRHRRRKGLPTRGWALGTILVATSPVVLSLLASVILGNAPPILALAAIPSATGLVVLVIILRKPPVAITSPEQY